jgi:small subunit ribosomal protein S16
MTPEERRKQHIINGSRRKRIAKGSGTSVEEVNRLLKQFVQMQKMLKSLGGMAGLAGGGKKARRQADADASRPQIAAVLEFRGPERPAPRLWGGPFRAAERRSVTSVRVRAPDALEESPMVAIRLRRAGSKKRPFFRVVVTDSRAARDSSFVEILGHYNPRTKPALVQVNQERVDFWIKQGAQPSDTVRTLIKNHLTPVPAAAPTSAAAQAAVTEGQ